MKDQLGNSKKASSNLIQSETDFNDWLTKFESVDVDRHVEKFNSTTRNIMDNFIRNKVITVDDREPI